MAKIAFHRGDTHTVSLTFKVGGEVYTMASGDKLRVGIFKGKQCLVIKTLDGTAQGEDGKIALIFDPADTVNIHPGRYEYEGELVTTGGAVHTSGRGEVELLEDLITPSMRGDD